MAALVIGALAGLGCGKDPAEETRSYYYKGTNTTRSPEGQIIGMGETLLRRVFDGPKNQIIEHVVTKDAQQGVQENTLTFEVTGATFKDPAAGATGELAGEPWEWTQWTAHGALPNGLKIESRTGIDPDAINIDMSFTSGGTVQLTLKHELTATSQSEFEKVRTQWVAP